MQEILHDTSFHPSNLPDALPQHDYMVQSLTGDRAHIGPMEYIRRVVFSDPNLNNSSINCLLRKRMKRTQGQKLKKNGPLEGISCPAPAPPMFQGNSS